jgi:UDP-sulfoquinovose synthase
VPIASLACRVARWHHLTGHSIGFDVTDLTNHLDLSRVFKSFQPEAVVHFAEQRSAPFSMVDRDHAVFTQVNNVVGTRRHN